MSNQKRNPGIAHSFTREIVSEKFQRSVVFGALTRQLYCICRKMQYPNITGRYPPCSTSNAPPMRVQSRRWSTPQDTKRFSWTTWQPRTGSWPDGAVKRVVRDCQWKTATEWAKSFPTDTTSFFFRTKSSMNEIRSKYSCPRSGGYVMVQVLCRHRRNRRHRIGNVLVVFHSPVHPEKSKPDSRLLYEIHGILIAPVAC